MNSEVVPGKILRRSVPGEPPVDYYAYIPRQGQRHNRVMISVHGISRNAVEHLSGFSSQAETHGVVMLAPLFSQQNFPSYQRLGASAAESRADQALDSVLRDAESWIGVTPFPLRIFGFSGGGQFTHRYALFHPERVARMALAAPGWYTFPDPEKRYPFGLRPSPKWPKLKFLLTRYLKIHTLVLVGEEDDLRTEDLNRSRRIDAAQGLTRVERGERWVNAMKALTRAFHVPARIRLEAIPNANHAFESYLSHPSFSEDVFDFLFPERR